MTTSSNGNVRNTSQVVVDAGLLYRALILTPVQSTIQNQLLRWGEADVTLFAPTLWRYELTAALTEAHHFGHLTEKEVQNALQDMFDLPITLVPPDDALVRSAQTWTVKLQRAAAYDSFYLALAERLQCEFWTADKRLFNAASVEWVRYLGTEPVG
jgi:predicted nucleic acid-binding protein